MPEFSLEFDEDWPKYYNKQDKSIQIIIRKKLSKLKTESEGRHLKHGLAYFVLEFGQYRIAYKKDEPRKAITLYFVGDHKEYEKWIGIK
jgi:mRNA-degrading endonuclease RelE of RelBE toxin-antitoxin system